MREIRTSGATRGGGVTLVTSPLLYWLPFWLRPRRAALPTSRFFAARDDLACARQLPRSVAHLRDHQIRRDHGIVFAEQGESRVRDPRLVQEPRNCARRFTHCAGTASTGHFALRTTRSVVLPRNASRMPLRPSVTIAMRSASLDTSRI